MSFFTIVSSAWPDVGIKVDQYFPKVAQHIATVVFQNSPKSQRVF